MEPAWQCAGKELDPMLKKRRYGNCQHNGPHATALITAPINHAGNRRFFVD
jgi:hypothetical protein